MSNSRQSAFAAGIALVVIIASYFLLGSTMRAMGNTITIFGYTAIVSVWVTSILMLAVILWQRRAGEGTVSLGLSRPPSIIKAIIFGIVGAIVIQLIVGLGLFRTGLVEPAGNGIVPQLVSGPNVAIALTLSLVTMWVNAAFGEELLFRGFLMNKIDQALPGKWANGVLSAAIVATAFGLVHVPSQGMTGLIVTGFVGFLLGVFYVLMKRNLWPVVIAHGVINTISIVAASQAG